MKRCEPDISVVIVSHNARELLGLCLRSVEASAGGMGVEVIVVDSGSSDGSADWVRKHHPACAVIESKENLGFSRANNLGLRRARGRYVLLLNPDTMLGPDVLRSMRSFMNARPEVGMATCKLVTGDGSMDLACRRAVPTLWDGFCRASGISTLFPRSRLFARYNLTYLDENETCEVEAVNGAFMFVRKEALEAVGPLDEDYFMYMEDLDWCCRFLKAGWKIAYHPESVTLHLKGQSGNRSSSAMIRRLFESTEIFYGKHCFPDAGPFYRRAVILSLCLWKHTTLVKNFFRKEKRTRP